MLRTFAAGLVGPERLNHRALALTENAMSIGAEMAELAAMLRLVLKQLHDLRDDSTAHELSTAEWRRKTQGGGDHE